jgi:hypothetical protein
MISGKKSGEKLAKLLDEVLTFFKFDTVIGKK